MWVGAVHVVLAGIGGRGGMLEGVGGPGCSGCRGCGLLRLDPGRFGRAAAAEARPGSRSLAFGVVARRTLQLGAVGDVVGDVVATGSDGYEGLGHDAVAFLVGAAHTDPNMAKLE